MKPSKNTGRLLGLLFLLSLILGAAGTFQRGFSGDAKSVEFLSNLIASADQMKIAILLDMLASSLGVAIAIFVFPLIKKYSLRLAAAYLAIASINFAIITVSNIIHIALLSLGQDFELSSAANLEHFKSLSQMLYDAYYWTHFLMLLLYSLSGALLFYFLFKTALIHRWLCLWGILAAAIVFLGGALQLADIKVSFVLFLQNGIFMLTFIGYLLIMGFREVNTAE